MRKILHNKSIFLIDLPFFFNKTLTLPWTVKEFAMNCLDRIMAIKKISDPVLYRRNFVVYMHESDARDIALLEHTVVVGCTSLQMCQPKHI